MRAFIYLTCVVLASIGIGVGIVGPSTGASSNALNAVILPGEQLPPSLRAAIIATASLHSVVIDQLPSRYASNSSATTPEEIYEAPDRLAFLSPEFRVVEVGNLQYLETVDGTENPGASRSTQLGPWTDSYSREYAEAFGVLSNLARAGGFQMVPGGYRVLGGHWFAAGADEQARLVGGSVTLAGSYIGRLSLELALRDKTGLAVGSSPTQPIVVNFSRFNAAPPVTPPAS